MFSGMNGDCTKSMERRHSGSDGKSLVENIRAAFEEVCSENPDLAAIIR